jgi:hypothetical protein
MSKCEGESATEKWSSLEIAKLISTTATPITIAIVGAVLTMEEARREKIEAIEEARYEKIQEKRSQLWDQLGPQLNDIHAYMLFIGKWKELDGAKIIKEKRDCDRLVFSYQPFFTRDFKAAYDNFMGSSFKAFCADRKNACLRTTPDGRETEDKIDRGRQSRPSAPVVL